MRGVPEDFAHHKSLSEALTHSRDCTAQLKKRGDPKRALGRDSLPQIAVVNSKGQHAQRVLWRVAKELIDKGLAVKVDDQTIQYDDPQSHGLRCGQAVAYEKRGAEKFPQDCTGGLTRTETKPAPFSRYKAARVGHQ